MKSRIISTLALSLVLLACDQTKPGKENSQTLKTSKQLQIEEIVKEENKPIVVEEKSFFGVSSGTPISDFEQIATKGRIQTEDGIIEVYNIEQKGREIGYFLPDSEDGTLVGDLFIQSPKAITEQGIKVGSTLENFSEKNIDFELVKTKKGKSQQIKSGKYIYKINQKSKGSATVKNELPNTLKVIEIIIRK